MKKNWLAFAALILLISGCAYRPPAVIALHSTFDAEHAAKLLEKGNNSITGNAFMRQNGGGVVTCAGSEVRLIPATDYATERMQYVYRNSEFTRQLFSPEESRYYTFQLKTRCDSQGNFLFENVSDGEFYATTTVFWSVGYYRQGGMLTEKVSVSGGESKRIIMAK